MVASTVMVPAGWQQQGGVTWNPQNLCGPGYNIDFQSISPDGYSAIHIFPMQHWQWNSTGTPLQTGCPTQQITSVRQFIEMLVQRARPGSRILDYRIRGDIQQEFAQLNQVTPMPMGEIRAWVEAGEALIGYQQSGVDIRETIIAAVAFTLSRYEASMGVPGAEYLSASTFPGFAMRAPNGQLDFQLAEMVRKSARPNPEWTRRISQHNAKISNIRVQGAKDRAAITSRTYDEIRQMQADSWRKYNESSDYLSREQSEAIRGVETYNDPYNGGTVQLDSSYEKAWQLDDGTYVLTNDHSFNPYEATGQGGQLLTPTP